MALHKIVHKFKGMLKDIAKESFSPEYYFDARNIKVTATDKPSTLAISNEKGTSLEFEIPAITSITTSGGNTRVAFSQQTGITSNSPLIYDGVHPEVSTLNLLNPVQNIIGYTSTNDLLVILTTNNTGVDCIWKVTKNPNWRIELVYVNNLNFSNVNPPELEIRYDNEEFIKLYISDFVNQVRHISLTESNVHNLQASFLDVVPQIELSQPKVIETTWGGLHTTGMVQYVYNLYKIGGAQSKLSPVSDLVAIASPNRGGDVNEVIGQTNKLEIANIDTRYDSIKVYSIKYNSYNQDPLVNVIADERITDSTAYFYDDGKPLYAFSLEELLFLGGDPIYAKSIESKNNRLFLANYKLGNFDLDFDARAYSYSPNSSIASLKTIEGSTATFSDAETQVPTTHDSINPDLDIYKYQKNSTVLGGSGKYVKYYLRQRTVAQLEGNVEDLKFFKSRETYRIGIEFYNKLGQYSLPKWIADFKAPHGNINGLYNILEVELTPAAISYLQANDVIGWRVLRAKRDVTDMQILSQGVVNPTIFQLTNDTDKIQKADQMNDGETFEDSYIKQPSTFLRTFNTYIEDTIVNNYSPANLAIKLIQNGMGAYSYKNSGPDYPHTEIYTGYRTDSDNNVRRHLTYIYTKLFNFYSPEVLFNENFSLESSVYFNPIGTYRTQSNKCWGRKYDTRSRQVLAEFRNNSGISLYKTSLRQMHDYGLIGPSGRTEEFVTEFYQYYRNFSNFQLGYNYNQNIDLLDFPKSVEPGSEVIYANDSKLRFFNSLYTIISDGVPVSGWSKNNLAGIDGVNTQGTRSLIMSTLNRAKLEDLYYDSAGVKSAVGLPMAELSRVLPNQYGGKSYEAKKRTNYLRIGDYNSISSSSVVIENPGDVFAQTFMFSRLIPISKDIFDGRLTQYAEIVSVPIETTIDLKNRNDASNYNWDSKFQPLDQEFHKYNKVYSQEADWNVTRDLEYTFKEVEEFPNAIITTRPKIDNELIDSWTQVLLNEELKVDGVYGPITKIKTHNDNMMSFQPKAIAAIAIQPRVQTVSTDGVSIELGSGGILHDYQYLTTTSGCSNKYGIYSGPTGLYYYDLLNNSFNALSGGDITNISLAMGFETEFKKLINTRDMLTDNPFINKGIILGKDPINNNILLVYKNTTPFTLAFSEDVKSFVTYLDYHPFLLEGFKNLFLSAKDKKIYSHYTGEYNNYYGTIYPSTITLLSSGSEDSIFNNLHYRFESYIGDVEDPKKNFDTIQVFNEYQDSNVRNLVLNNNLFKKFRNWRIVYPRDGVNKLDRLRGPWTYTKLTFTPNNNQKFVCHDLSIIIEDASIKA